MVVDRQLLEVAFGSVAPALFLLLLYSPFVGWLEQSMWRLFAVVFLGEYSLMFLIKPLHSGETINALVDAAGMTLLLSPLIWRLWRKNRDSAENLLRLDTLIKTIPDAIFFKDGEGRWLTVNPVGQELFRLKGVPWQGKTEEELIRLQPELAEAHRACKSSDDHVWAHGFQETSMESVTDRQGLVRHFEVHKIPLFERDGSRHGLVIIGRDITEQQSAGEALELAASVFDNSHEGILITSGGNDPRILQVNRSFCDTLGYTPEEVIGQNPRILQSGRHGPDFYRNMWLTINSTGLWRGEIWNRRKNGEVFPEWLSISAIKNPQGEITRFVGIFEDMTEIMMTQDRLEQVANHDPLTGLPNRRLLNELLEHAIRRAGREQGKIAVLFIDLDRFKIVNDTLGHAVGDGLLTQVAERTADAIRESDLLARLGGDEFIVVMDSLRDANDAAAVARKIIQALSQPFYLNGHEVFIGASVGISVYPEDGLDSAELVKAADIAMYQVKNEDRNNYCFFSSTLSTNRNERFTLETELRHAIERNQLELFYQPQVSLEDQRILGAEALLRWRHPELGLVSPAHFIPLAEETGLILPIGEWVLRESARQARAWVEQGHPLQWVSVNVSGIQIQRSNFSDTAYGILIETGCDSGLLELEITESTAMHSTTHVSAVIDRLKQLGFRLAIDDFGTGYSSMSHLKRLSMDKLKIDQSFVRDLPHNAQDAAIARAILALGHSMGLAVIAEGVETAEQAEFLLEMGCEEAQGYHFGRPMPAQEFERLLANK